MQAFRKTWVEVDFLIQLCTPEEPICENVHFHKKALCFFESMMFVKRLQLFLDLFTKEILNAMSINFA